MEIKEDWLTIGNQMSAEQNLKSEEAKNLTARFLTSKNMRKWDLAESDYCLNKRREYRVNKVMHLDDPNTLSVIGFLKGGRMLLAKSAPCICTFIHINQDNNSTHSGFLGVVQENETRLIVLFPESTVPGMPSCFPYKFNANSWVCQSDTKLIVSVGESPLMRLHFSAEDHATYFKDCIIKVNYGPFFVTEIFQPQAIEQLICRKLLNTKDAGWTNLLVFELTNFVTGKCEAVNFAEEKKSPRKNPLSVCILDSNHDWIDNLENMLDTITYHRVDILPDEAMEDILSDVEKDMETLKSILPFCCCSEKNGKTSDKLEQLREMRVLVAALKTLQQMSVLYMQYKDKLAKAAENVKALIENVCQQNIQLNSPTDISLSEVFSKIEFVEVNHVAGFTSTFFGHFKELYLKAIEKRLFIDDFAIFEEVDGIVRKGSVDAFKHWKLRFTDELDQSAQPIRSYWNTGKAVFGEPVLQISRNGERMIVDELTETKSLSRAKYSFYALLGQISGKQEALLHLAALYNESILKHLNFSAKEWSELVEIAHSLKDFCGTKEVRQSNVKNNTSIRPMTPSSENSSDAFEFEFVTKTSSSGSTDLSNQSTGFNLAFLELNSTKNAFDSEMFGKFTEDDFRDIRSISEGRYGAVLVVTHQLGKVVVKIFHDAVLREQMDKVEQELSNIKKLQSNDHIVKLLGFFYPDEESFGFMPIGYVMEYIRLSLHNVIHSRRGSIDGPFLYEYSFLQALKHVQSLASAFASLHDLRKMHRDIKPENILVDTRENGEMQIKICDLGTCGDVSKNQTTETGSHRYMSPEMLCYKEGVGYTTKTDVYSLAITIWELFHRKQPFYDIKNDVLRCEEVKCGRRPKITCPVWKDYPPMNRLMEKCWAQNPDDRLTMAQIEEKVKDLIICTEPNRELAEILIC